METFQYLFQFMLFPLFFLSGAFFVLDRVPPWIAFIASVNPLTYAIDLFRHILYADIELGELTRSLLLVNSVAHDILTIAVISVVLLAASVVSFARMEYQNRRYLVHTIMRSCHTIHEEQLTLKHFPHSAVPQGW